MADDTGGHWLDTGDGPVRLDAPEDSVPSASVAWTAYQAHRRDCTQCQTSVWRCPDGNALWDEYLRIAS